MTETHPVTSFIDVPVVVGVASLVATAIVQGVLQGPFRLAASVPLLFFLPGYGLLAALFPGDGRGHDERDPLTTSFPVVAGRGGGLRWRERVALAVPVSLSLLPPLGVVFALAGVPLTVATIAGALATVAVLGTAVGAIRRVRLPAERRLTVPADRWLDDVRSGVIGAPTVLDTVLNVVLVLAVLAALTGLAFGLAAPDRGESYTEAALLTGDRGSLVAGNYTTQITAGEPIETTVTVENQQNEPRTYSLVVVVERVRVSDGDTTVLERTELLRDRSRVADGGTWYAPTTVRPTMLGTDLRLSYYVYSGEAPETPSSDSADRHLYLWIAVNPSGETTAGNGTTPTGNATASATRVPIS